MDQTFQIPKCFDMDVLSESSFSVFHGPPVWVKICFSKDVAGYIKEKTLQSTQEITDRADRSISFSEK